MGGNSAEIFVWILPALFFIALSAIAFFVFFLLRKTLKIIIRLILVGLIMLIAVIGSLVLWFNLGKSEPAKRPAVQKSR